MAADQSSAGAIRPDCWTEMTMVGYPTMIGVEAKDSRLEVNCNPACLSLLSIS
jgi:hypothetical protein